MPADPARPSKTQLKREADALQALGESLIPLPDSELAAIPVPSELLDAIRSARRMTKRGALHRQKKFIGKLMRQIDAGPIRDYMQRRDDRAREAVARFHRAEQWRDRLLADGDDALGALLEAYPDADRQHLRRLMRDAAEEQRREAAPRAARQLFRYLDGLME